MNKDLHDKVWKLLDEKGLSLNEKVMIMSNFANTHKDKYPFITNKYENGKIKYFHSEIKEISNLMFYTEQEVILANAIFENVKDNFNANDFMQYLKFTFRLIGVESKWA